MTIASIPQLTVCVFDTYAQSIMETPLIKFVVASVNELSFVIKSGKFHSVSIPGDFTPTGEPTPISTTEAYKLLGN